MTGLLAAFGATVSDISAVSGPADESCCLSALMYACTSVVLHVGMYSFSLV